MLVLCGAVLFTTGCTKLESRDQMSKGVQAYRRQAYADAVKHFQKAVKLDSGSENARVYLATAYMVQWVPGANTPDNNRNFEMAQQTFEQVLKRDPSNSLALGSLAFMAYNKASTGTHEERHAALEKARDWNRKRIAAKPADPDSYYDLGVIDFDEVYPPLQTARVEENIPAAEAGPLKNPKLKKALRRQYLVSIESGISNLKKCLSLDPENHNAMAYINLLLRRKALLEDTTGEAKADAAQAEQWFRKGAKMKQTKPPAPSKRANSS
ncbi:MAG: tetratricopeptide repeat protein [Bryobacteraceae bacterium]